MNSITVTNNNADNHGNIKAYDADGLEVYIDQKTGESFTSISGLARMCNVSKQAISKYISGVNQNEFKKAEIFTTTGLKTVNLITEDLILEALGKYNPIQLVKIAKLSLRLFLHTTAGFKINDETEKLTTEVSELRQLVETLQSEVETLKNNQKQLAAAKTSLQATPEKLRIFEDLVKLCKGQAITTSQIRTSALLRRKDVRMIFGKKGQSMLLKAETLLLFREAAKHGFGTFDKLCNVFKPV